MVGVWWGCGGCLGWGLVGWVQNHSRNLSVSGSMLWHREIQMGGGLWGGGGLGGLLGNKVYPT